MSASREKQNRQDLAKSSAETPKTLHEAEQMKKEKRSNALYTAIAVAFVILAVVVLVWRSNIIPKVSSAATVDGEKYTAGEVSFYYYNSYMGLVNNMSYMLSYIGLDTNTSLESQTVNETAAAMLGIEAGQTWHDYFLDSGLKQLSAVQTALKQAEAEGFVYPDSVQAQYDDNMASLEESAAAYGMTAEQLISANFGSMVTLDIYGEQLMRMIQYSAYADAYENALTYSDSEIQTAYEADPDAYDAVSYEYLYLSGAAESTTDADGNTVDPTEEESTAAMEAAKAKAEGLLASWKAGSSLESLSGDGVTYQSVDSGAYSTSALTEWLFADGRKAGDSTVLDSGTTVYVVVFHDRFQETYNTIDVRHILIQPESGTLTSEDEGYEAEQAELNAAAQAKAEELYEQWKSGEATEDSFAALAMAESVDGSKYDGGLYTMVAEGDMIAAFNDWCFADGRKAGDTGIVETPYGFHIMYFSGEDLPAWQAQVVSDLKLADANEWAESLSADCTIKSGLGMKFVG